MMLREEYERNKKLWWQQRCTGGGTEPYVCVYLCMLLTQFCFIFCSFLLRSFATANAFVNNAFEFGFNPFICLSIIQLIAIHTHIHTHRQSNRANEWKRERISVSSISRSSFAGGFQRVISSLALYIYNSFISLLLCLC